MSDIEEWPPTKRQKVDNSNEDTTHIPDLKIDKESASEKTSSHTIKTEPSDFQEDSVYINQHNYVTQEELQKLREFQVLDEVNEDDDDSEASGTNTVFFL